MSELNEVWSAMLAEARENAALSGRGHVADYLDLKASNDLLRQTGVDWLFQTLIEHAADANRDRNSIAIERTEPLVLARQGWVHFAFEVKDIDAEFKELTAKGIKFHIEPRLFPDESPAVKLAFFKDPDGNDLELVEPLKTRYPNER